VIQRGALCAEPVLQVSSVWCLAASAARVQDLRRPTAAKITASRIDTVRRAKEHFPEGAWHAAPDTDKAVAVWQTTYPRDDERVLQAGIFFCEHYRHDRMYH
jgi:hypothetical protein